MHRLVFINPNQKLHSLYRRHLSNYFMVDSAYDGLQGLRLIRSVHPQIVVSEFQMPLISGASILEFVRNHERLNSIPFIFLSQEQPNQSSLGLGANDWLVAAQSSPDKLVESCHLHLKLASVPIKFSA